MKLEQLTNLMHEAPASGWMLAYCRTAVIFQPYRSLEEVKQSVKDQELLELHLFDEDKEYRALTSDSSRFANHVVEWTADFPNDQNTVFAETVQLENNLSGKIQILNHISHGENGMAVIDDYRLVRIGG